MSTKRITALQKKILAQNLAGMVILRRDHVRYLCGYSGSNGLLFVTPRKTLFLTDFRYTDQSRREVKGAQVNVMKKGDLIACLSDFPELNKKNAV